MEKLKLVFTIIGLIISIVAASFYRKRRKLQRRLCCYLVSDESKPQYSFKHVIADNSYSLFKHLNQTEGSNSHPYEKEISSLLENSGIEKLRFVNGEVNLELKGNHVWVDKEEQLKHLSEILSKQTVFAVDTEQHSLRSFLGFTALMQISTHTEDYLVDTIALHDVVHILRPVFADPKICKVFHGADSDVIWLQRDFHIYVVNLFDTAKACEVLSKPQRSLAYLLETYCGVATNKVLQREDWRQRPLSEGMIQYARTDAHYLLYIADCMASELKAQNTAKPEFLDVKFHFLLVASRLSNKICLQRYAKEAGTSPGHSSASSISSRYLNGQGVALKSETMELVEWWCMWRDIMARVHDESLRYVLSDQAIVALASKAPKTEAEILSTISEAGLSSDFVMVDSAPPSPSPVVVSHLEDICYLLVEKINNLDDVLGGIIQKHLGPSGCCPLSIYNYGLLKNFNWMVTHGSSAKQNRGETKRYGIKAPRQLSMENLSPNSQFTHNCLNCRIYASDGRLLFYSNRRKLEWYLRRNLAKRIDKDPPAIMLLAEPKGHPEDEDYDLYLQSKKNMCVGCGERNHYLRYKLVPPCYRMHLPEHLKSRCSHDIVLVCVDCYKIALSAAEKHKRCIAANAGIPLRGTVGSKEARMSLRYAKCLVRHGSDMPPERREELTQNVMKFLGGKKIPEDLKGALLVGPQNRSRHWKKTRSPTVDALADGLESVRKVKHSKRNGMEVNTTVGDIHQHCDLTSATDEVKKMLPLIGFGAHGKQVVDHLLKEYGEDGIREFCESWRQVFVEAVKPRFLPPDWGVVHRLDVRMGCYNCGDISHRKAICPKLQEKNGQQNVCDNDNIKSNQGQQQPQNSKKPRNATESGAGKKQEIKGNCYKCGQQGHKMVNCPQPLPIFAGTLTE